jgi:hypothetical protein
MAAVMVEFRSRLACALCGRLGYAYYRLARCMCGHCVHSANRCVCCLLQQCMMEIEKYESTGSRPDWSFGAEQLCRYVAVPLCIRTILPVWQHATKSAPCFVVATTPTQQPPLGCTKSSSSKCWPCDKIQPKRYSVDCYAISYFVTEAMRHGCINLP